MGVRVGGGGWGRVHACMRGAQVGGWAGGCRFEDPFKTGSVRVSRRSPTVDDHP